MNTVDLLRELRALGIRIRVEGDQLAVKAPAGALTPELAARLRDHKAEILAFLRDAEFAPGGESASESLKGLADPASPPVSPDQRKEWHLQRLDPESSVYNAAGAFRLRGPLDTSALRTAIQAMVDRHAVLRSRFPAVNGEPVLVIEDEVRVEIPETDLSAVPEEEREGAMRAFLEEAADEILDLERGPPFLARLARLGPEDHAFFFMAHSVVWDGWCFDLLLREMTAHYEACLDGRSDALPPLPIQYPDYAAWQKLREERGDFKPHLDFWRRQLKGPIPHLGLPTDRPRKAESDYRGARVWSKVEKRILDGLRALARAEGATLYMVLLASLDVLLHRYTGRADFLVSSPLQGRTHPELEDLLGAFTNTLFFRARVESGESFRTLLRNVKETCLEAVQHQEAPSDQVIQIMDEQGLGRAPYEVIFVFQQTAARPTRMGPVSVHSISRGTRSVPVDLLMWAREYDDYMDGGFDYRTSLFDEERMERMVSHYHRLLDSIQQNPDALVKELPFLAEQEVAELLEWGSAGPLSDDASGDRGAETPTVGEGARVHFGSEVQTETQIREGIARARRQITSALSQGEAKSPDHRFALIMDGSPEAFMALGAAREISAPVVIFHPETRPPAISRRMKALGVHHLFAGPGFPPLSSEEDGIVMTLDLTAEPALEPQEATPRSEDGGVFYGTGGPVEAAEERPYHWALLEREASGLREHLGLGGDSGVALYLDGPPEQWVPVALATLAAGGSLFLPEPGQPPDGWELDDLVEKGDVSRLVAGSRAAQQLVDTGWEAIVDRALIGDPHTPESLLEAMEGRCGALEIGWGIPEAGGWILLEEIRGPDDRGLPRFRRTPWAPPLRVLDVAGQLVPHGVPGELWIDVGHGPGSGAPSGDGEAPSSQRVRWVGEGELALEGRRDRWESLRGHHIDLAKAESVLRVLNFIQDSHLQIKEHDGQRRMVAHIVPAPQEEVDEESLRNLLGDQGVPFARQIFFVRHEEIPRRWDGKVDERALEIRLEHADRDWSEMEPQTAEERALADIWKEVLGLPRVGIHDRFFDLGGHSLLAVQVTLRLEEEKGLRIDPRTLFFESLGQVAAGATPIAAEAKSEV